MKITIFGAGATGSMIGGELARAGVAVTLIARGAHLEAMRANGLTVNMNGEERVTHPACTDDPAAVGVQDAVIFTVKAHHAADAAEAAAPLIGPDTVVVAAQNGIPWWYFHGTGDAFEGHRLRSVDSDRRVWNAIGPERVLGGVINGSCALPRPGYVNHTMKKRSLAIGEPTKNSEGGSSERAERLAAAFAGTDIDAPLAENIRRNIWVKLLSNVAGATLCVLTRSTHGQVHGDPGCRAIEIAMMREAGAVAAGLGIDISAEIETRVADHPRQLAPQALDPAGSGGRQDDGSRRHHRRRRRDRPADRRGNAGHRHGLCAGPATGRGGVLAAIRGMGRFSLIRRA